VVGFAEQERQHANQREADRKSKTGIKPTLAHTIFCSVGLARKVWDEWGDFGNWVTYQGDYQWAINLPDSELTSARFLADLLLSMKKVNQRKEVKDWITPAGEGYWIISHVNPRPRNAPREIAGWDQPCYLSEAIEKDSYNIKTAGNKKLVDLWLCFTPERQPAESPTPFPAKRTPIKKGKGVKKEEKPEVKEEVKAEPSTPAKRPRSISAELSIRKRQGVTTRAQAALEPPAEEADIEQWEPLEKLLEGSATAGDVGDSEV
jgi:hypothetical protein